MLRCIDLGLRKNMRIMGFIVKRNDSIKANPFSLVFAGISLLSIFAGFFNTGFMASYRFGDSIIPREEQLVRTGPYLMGEVKLRNGVNIRFVPVDGGGSYEERWTNFDVSPDEILALVHREKGGGAAYLWLFRENPTRKVWKIEANSQVLMSYSRAKFVYGIDDSIGYSWFELSGIMLLMFLVSMCSIERKTIN